MALSAALVLSGLPRDQFSGELETIYSPGAVLLKSPSSSSIASSGYSSGTSSSRASLISELQYKSIENDVWALLDDNELNNDPLDETVIIDLPLKTPEVCGYEETVDIHKSFKYYLSVIAELESRMESYKEKEAKQQKQEAEAKDPKDTKNSDDLKIMYLGRDILDLGSNLADSASFCTPPKLERTVSNFFENRSVFSRIEGAPPLKFIKLTCQIDDCGFEEFIYY